MNRIMAKIIVKFHYIWWGIKHPIKYYKWCKLPKKVKKNKKRS